jgi:uncharacterized membrane protein YfcA
VTAWQVAAFLACAGFATAVQNVTGFALVLVLLGLTGVFDLAPLPDAANVATVLGLANGFVALRGRARSVDWGALRQTASGTVFGVAAGVFLLTWLSGNAVLVLRLLLGIVVIGCALLVLRRVQALPRPSSRLSFFVTGVLSGVLGGLFSASGPPLVYQFYRQPMTLDAVRDTLVALLAVGSTIRLLMVVGSGQFSMVSVGLGALAVPVVLGVAWWMKRHPPPWERAAVLRIVSVLLVVTGIGLMAPAVQGLVMARVG